MYYEPLNYILCFLPCEQSNTLIYHYLSFQKNQSKIKKTHTAKEIISHRLRLKIKKAPMRKTTPVLFVKIDYPN